MDDHTENGDLNSTTKLCGFEPKPIESVGNKLVLTFVSDFTVGELGFDIDYTVTLPPNNDLGERNTYKSHA